MKELNNYSGYAKEIIIDNSLEDKVFKTIGNYVLMNYNTLRDIEEKQSKESKELWK